MPEPQRAGIYCRISLASIGDTTKTDDQERICRDIARLRGWQVVQVYSDHSLSAWKKNVRRPAWEQMLADVEAGKINAIIAYHGDRLYRQPRDLEKLIDLAEVKGTKLASQLGDFDLGTSQGRMFARMLATVSEAESARTSERRKAQYERWRRVGRVRPGGWGGRPFGFETDGLTHRADEAAAVRDAARRILEGESARSIARELTTPAGNPFTQNTLTRLLGRPRYAGLMPDGVQQAAWAPILDRGTWEELRAALQIRATLNPEPTSAQRHLLSGIATCSECGHGLQIRSEHRPGKIPGYRCITPGCRRVQRSVKHLDEFVIGAVLARLNHPDNPAARAPARPELAREFAALQMQRADIEAALKDHTKGNWKLLVQRLESIDRRVAELREVAAGSASARLLGAHAGLTRPQWDGLSLGARRALVGACFRVTVLPASRRGPGFNPGDVQLEAPK